MGLFSPTINYQIKELGSVELHGDDAVIIDGDCESSKECKKLVKHIFENYEYKNCGSDKLEGKGVIVEMRKMKLFETVEKQKFFGGYKYQEEHTKSVYRITNIYFDRFTLLGGTNGKIKCTKCKWESDGFASANAIRVKDVVDYFQR